MLQIMIRPYSVDDAREVRDLFRNTVLATNFGDYSREQVEAWAAALAEVDPLLPGVPDRIAIVAVDSLGIILGFADMEPDGHIDRIYCRKDAVRSGVGSRLYEALEIAAKSLGLKQLLAEASVTARPFFERHGFRLIKEQAVTARGVSMKNYAMEKQF